MADENCQGGRMPPGDWGLLPQEWNCMTLPVTRELAKSDNPEYTGVPSHLCWNGGGARRRSGVDPLGRAAQQGRQHVSVWLAHQIQFRR